MATFPRVFAALAPVRCRWLPPNNLGPFCGRGPVTMQQSRLLTARPLDVTPFDGHSRLGGMHCSMCGSNLHGVEAYAPMVERGPNFHSTHPVVCQQSGRRDVARQDATRCAVAFKAGKVVTIIS